VELIRAADDLVENLAKLTFPPPVDCAYNPLIYARATYDEYLRRYAHPGIEAVLLGMNPGPFGMAQTGVPFGDCAAVRNWLGIQGSVGKPECEHPKRRIQGFDCPRSEVSGTRVWGWARDRFGTPEAFFRRFFVANYCPLCFMEKSGRNLTPDKLPAAEREKLFAACDEHLRQVIACLHPRWVIGIGEFARKRAAIALQGTHVQIAGILHPSPASPVANRGWAEQAEQQLRQLGLNV